MAETAHIPLPGLTTDADGTLMSTQFSDVYASRAGAAAQAEHVFLGGNGLPERWQSQQHFTIGELGFGTGTNFLTTWRSFLAHAPKTHRLHYIAFEKYPLSVKQLRELCPCEEHMRRSHPSSLAQPDGLRRYARNDMLYEQLLDAYPLRLPGWHRIDFDRVTLTLAIGDAAERVPELPDACINAWYLDGFAPSKNPELWGVTLMREVARTSVANGTFATYSASSSVRDALTQAGFHVEKRAGFAGKKAMLCGALGLHSYPRRGEGHLKATLQKTIIIGAGIAGATLARTLAERGIEVTVLERGEVASGASGNPLAALYPQLTRRWIPAAEWHFLSYAYALRYYRSLAAQGLAFDFASPGMAKLATDEEEAQKLRGIHAILGLDPAIAQWCEADQLAQHAGIALRVGGVWFPEGSLLSPATLCRALLADPRIVLHEHTCVTALTRQSGGWEVTLASHKTMQASQIILCNAQEATRYVPLLKLGLTAGQITEISTTSVATPLKSILCHSGYVVPHKDRYVIGATYDRADFSCAVTQANHHKNLAELAAALPNWLVSPEILAGRTSLRASTPDRLPCVGAVEEGLYVSTGFGSRGMISAPLAAEILASQLCAEPIPLTHALQAAMDPKRYQA